MRKIRYMDKLVDPRSVLQLTLTGGTEEQMGERISLVIASGGLVVGSALGMAGTFAPSTAIRGLLWGLDGIVLVLAAALLTVHHFRKGNDVVAAGFLVYVAGQSLVLSSASMDLEAGRPMFAAGAGLWAVSLAMLSAARVAAPWVRILGGVAAALFLVVATRIFSGQPLTAMSEPLPSYAYPFLVAALIGWAWERYRSAAT